MSYRSSCCPDAEFTFLTGGLQVRERNVQTDGVALQFFPYRAIQSARYTYSREDREGQISIWIAGNGTPGAGGLSFRWRFPCSEGGQSKYDELVARLGA
jgi:hypothetical protein